MIKVRGESQEPGIDKLLGVGGQAELVPVLMPMSTYRLILDRASQDGCTASDVLDRALTQYFAPPKPVAPPPPEIPRQAALIVKRKKQP